MLIAAEECAFKRGTAKSVRLSLSSTLGPGRGRERPISDTLFPMTPAEWIPLVAVVGVLIGLLISSRALRATERALRGTEQETALRMRPWIGVTSVDYEPPQATGPRRGRHQIPVHYLNTGLLPAQSLNIDMRAHSVVLPGLQSTANDASFDFEGEHGGLTVFPGEDNVQRFQVLEPGGMGRLPRWLGSGRDVRLTGSITYGFGGKTYVTTFHAVIGATTHQIHSWANQSAS